MPANTAFEISATPMFETWHLEAQPTEHRSNEDAQLDAIVRAVTYRSLCGLPAVDVRTAPLASAKRTRIDARRDGMNDYKLIFQLSGNSFLSQNDRTTELRPGDFGLVDVTRPVDLIRGEIQGRGIGLHLPRQQLIAHLGFEPRGGLCWRGQDTLPARLLLRLLEDSAQDDGAMPEDANHFIQLAIYNLVGGLFGTNDLPRHFSQADKLFLRVCSIVKRYFCDPDIDPSHVAAEAGISIRYLQKIFAMRGTTYGRFLKAFRLSHAASVLDHRSVAHRQPRLTEVASSCGYRDYAHFARDFRARYGQTPGAFTKCPGLPLAGD